MADEQKMNPIGSELLREEPSFADIVLEFVNGLGTRLQTMEDAISQRDFEALRVAAHQLKGSGGGYGYPTVSERAAELEQLAKTQALDDCVKAFDDLQHLCDRVVVEPDK
jgi:HPt (histidine-containing phosphotransfer) domain-containing protein